jgi:dihydrofolate reductase
MGRITANFFISLDGVVERPDQWHFPYFDDEMAAVVGAGTENNAAFLMGRTLHDEWASYWPDSTNEPFASFINEAPKYVISGSMEGSQWENTTVVPGDVEAVRHLENQIEGDIGMSGSATTVRWLLANGLLDELVLLVHPLVVGHGQRLFEDAATSEMTLTHSATHRNGVLHLTYAPA